MLIPKLNSGKNSKLWYYLKNHLGYWIVPNSIYRAMLKSELDRFDRASSNEQEYIMDRVKYYCALDTSKIHPLCDNPKLIGQHTYANARKTPSAYFFDSHEYTRYFDPNLKWDYLFGDVIHTVNHPAITKCRPIIGYRANFTDNSNNILLSLDKVRHFVRLHDTTPYNKKQDRAIFRGDVMGKRPREIFMEQYINHPRFDIGDVSKHSASVAEWKKPPISLYDHLQYKFIFSLEGNDVATNLKWIMTSNSIAVMPHPTMETWYMEGRLKAGEHYIEIASDFSNIDQQLDYYLSHPKEAEEIIANAKLYRAQFDDPSRERLIAIKVLERYFQATGQL